MAEPLEICIPTFNRAEQLKKLLKDLVAICPTDVTITILDNCSTDSTNEVIQSFKQQYRNRNIRHIINPANVGLLGNILRCFEVCEGDWLWIHGDDDSPTEKAFELILDAINNHGNAIGINFETTISIRRVGKRSKDIVAIGPNDLVESIDCFSNMLFITSTIYRAEVLRRRLACGYMNAGTWAPHTAMLLEEMESNTLNEFVFACGKVADWQPNDRNDGWQATHAFDVQYGLQKLPFLLKEPKSRLTLSRKINAVHRTKKMSEVIGWCEANNESFAEFQLHLAGMINRASTSIDSLIRFSSQLALRALVLHPNAGILRAAIMIFKKVKRFVRIGKSADAPPGQ